MKCNLKGLIVIIITSFLFMPNTSYASNQQPELIYNNVIESIIREPVANEITTQQLKTQIYYFKQALDEFGATSPQRVIEL